MKNLNSILFIAILGGLVLSSCGKDDETNNDNNNNTLPDAVFNMTVTGAADYTHSFTLPGNVATDYAINGTQQSLQSLLIILAMDLPTTWQFSLTSDVSSMATGTYDITPGMSSYVPDISQAIGYTATSGTVVISKASLYQDVSSIEDWFIDGTFSGVYQDNNTPPNQVTITGSFSGVNIKSQ